MAKSGNDKRVSLVLSIFKGENFVCKKPSGYKLQITAKLGQQEMHSGCIQLVSTESEPQFYSQLVWSFVEREWRAVRSQKEAIKVECLLINEKTELSSVLGYCVLYVKDAFQMKDWSEIDPSNAITSTLCGLKDPWKMYGPKLKLLLHFEESTIDKPIPPKSPSKSLPKVPQPQESDEDEVDRRIVPQPTLKPPKKSDASISTIKDVNKPKSLDENMNNNNNYQFQVNSESGYFELGSVSEDDDLYIINITIISGTNLHKMRFPKGSENSTFWMVEYDAYGCVIKTDPFMLELQEKNSRTFIGDKAQAKIRANSVKFWSYLKNTSLELRLLRYNKNDETKKEVMGVGFVDLQDLASPQIRQLKYTLELISEFGDYPFSDSDSKPEIKVLVELESLPSFFSSTVETSRIDSPRRIENQDNSNSSCELAVNASADMFATCISEGEVNISPSLPVNPDVAKKTEENVAEFVGSLEKMSLLDVEQSEPQFPKGSPTEILSELVIDYSKPKLSPPPKAVKKGEGVSEINFEKLENQNSPRLQDLESDLSCKSPTTSQEENPSQVTDTCSTNKNTENTRFELNGKQMTIAPPGSYKIIITLSSLFVKSRNRLNDFILSYMHPPVGIQKPIVFSAEYNPSLITRNKPDVHGYTVVDGSYELTVIIPSFSEDLLGDHLKVTLKLKEPDSNKLTYFGHCAIPFGDIFLEKSLVRNSNRRLKDEAAVYDNKPKKVGRLEYSILLTPCDFPIPHNKQVSDTFKSKNEGAVDRVDTDAKSHRSKKDIKNKPDSTVESQNKTGMISIEEYEIWRENEEKLAQKKFMDKEKAYLTILSKEFKKREAERKKLYDDKHDELMKRQKDNERLTESLTSKEKDMKEMEHQLQISARQKSLDQEYSQQEFDIKMKKVHDKYEHEIATLQRRNDTLNAELKSLKGQQLILEQRLEAKEDKIQNLISRSHSPNSELVDKANRLEIENEILKKDLKKAEKDRQEFKNQAKSLLQKVSLMQAEKDLQLKDENENLRLQILASKEQKEMKKERKEIKGLSNQLREYREKGKANSDGDKRIEGQLKERNKVESGHPGASCGGDSVTNSSNRTVLNREIHRLSKQRHELLETGCYNNYDHVVKEMEARIVNLAQRLDIS